jgi:hypothetical protein
MADILKFPEPLPNDVFLISEINLKIGYSPRDKKLGILREFTLPDGLHDEGQVISDFIAKKIDAFALELGDEMTTLLRKQIDDLARAHMKE